MTDGSVEDWEELFGEPSLTRLDFTGFDRDYRLIGYDPSDLDFRIYLGWNGASDRIYMGAICIDDVYIGEDERSFNYLPRDGEDSVKLFIDGDHDGSPQWDETVARRDDDRVFPFYEITDEAAIDVTDGSIEDWEEAVRRALSHEPGFHRFHLLRGVRGEHGLQPFRSRLPHMMKVPGQECRTRYRIICRGGDARNAAKG